MTTWKKSAEEYIARIEAQLASIKEDLKNLSDDFDGIENFATDNFRNEVDAFEEHIQNTYQTMDEENDNEENENDED